MRVTVRDQAHFKSLCDVARERFIGRGLRHWGKDTVDVSTFPSHAGMYTPWVWNLDASMGKFYRKKYTD